jgi:asparagine synthase (glutamine-hydrolysing)
MPAIPTVIAGRLGRDAGDPAATVRTILPAAPVSALTAGELVVASTAALARDPEGGLCGLSGFVESVDELVAELQLPPAADPQAVLLAAWRRLGLDLLPRLRGEFSVVLWDGRRLLAARDQLGGRALFWRRDPAGLVFATELRPLLELMHSTPDVSRSALTQWLASRELRDGATLFTGVRKLPPAHALLVDESGAREAAWWTPRFREPSRTSAPEAARGIREALDGGIAGRIPAQKPAAVLLSGGLDSAAVATVAARSRRGQVRAYTAAFPDFEWIDESELVDLVTGQLGLEGTRVEVPGRGLLAGGLRHIAQWRLPPAGWSDWWEQPLIRAAAADGSLELLSGDGGDEVFGSRDLLLADRLRRGRVLAAWRLARRTPGAARAPRRAAVRYFLDFGVRAAPASPTTPFWLRPDAAAQLEAESARPIAPELDGPRWWTAIASHLTRGHDGLGLYDHLRRRALWAGLESRTPLLALPLVELALGLPPELSFDPKLDRMPLRLALEGQLDDRIRLRGEKAVFNRLVGANLLHDLPAIQATLDDLGDELAGVADPARVSELLERGPKGHPEHQFRWAQEVLRLVMARCWTRELAQPGAADQLLAQGLFSDPKLRRRPLRSTVPG